MITEPYKYYWSTMQAGIIVVSLFLKGKMFPLGHSYNFIVAIGSYPSFWKFENGFFRPAGYPDPL
jgi:hypothetical protein